MNRLILILAAIVLSTVARGQIVITAADMPVAGDTLRYSFASPTGTAISPGDSGINVAWSYSLTPLRQQAVDTYKTALAVNPAYAFLIGTTAYGYKVADSFPGAPLPITNIYTFFEKKTGPSRYQAQAFGAFISGLPTPANYSKPDVWYFFPLTYLSTDSSDFALNISLATLGSLKEKGYRLTRVDGWGTITTPYYTTPVNCIRVRSEIHQVDSVSSSFGTFGFPVNTVEYKWLVNGEHYPALWVTSNLSPFGGMETISNIRYRDSARSFDTAVIVDTTPVVSRAPNVQKLVTTFKAYPNPAATGLITIDLPAEWKQFSIEVYDMQSRCVATFANKRQIDLSSMPSGKYIARIVSGETVGYAPITR